MKAVAYIPRGTDPADVPQNIEGDLEAAGFEWEQELSETGCTYKVNDEDYEAALLLIEDPYKIVGAQ